MRYIVACVCIGTDLEIVDDSYLQMEIEDEQRGNTAFFQPTNHALHFEPSKPRNGTQ